MRTYLSIILFLTLSVLFSVVINDSSIVPSDYQPRKIENRKIIPEKSVGKISKKSSLAELQKAFGKGNIVDLKIDAGNYEYKDGTRILTKDEPIDILWKDVYFTKPWRVIISDEKSKFLINDKIKIGTPIEEVIKVNERDFILEGFNGTDRLLNRGWNNGKLSPNIILEFKPTILENIQKIKINEDYNQFRTSDESIKSLKLIVSKIIIEW